MSRATAWAAYETAREAMRREDWPAVFACNLKKIAANAVSQREPKSIKAGEALFVADWLQS